MLNQSILIGKVVQMPVLQETPNKLKVANLLLEVERGYKNSDGTVDSDIFNVQLWRGIAESCCDLCTIGSILVVKGRLQSFNVHKENTTYYNAELVAEKVSFIEKK